jgi:molybdopterin-biosynthesis enzyme MoeA-like protein
MNWTDIMANPKGYALKKTMHQFLQHRFPQNEQVVERISHYLVTESDVNAFLKLMMDVYEIAYFKAIEEHKTILAQHGIKVRVAQDSKEGV